MSDTGWKSKVRESEYNFLQWGKYMKRATIAERKVAKLKSLLLLTDPSVEDVPMMQVTLRQFNEYTKWCEQNRMEP